MAWLGFFPNSFAAACFEPTWSCTRLGPLKDPLPAELPRLFRNKVSYPWVNPFNRLGVGGEGACYARILIDETMTGFKSFFVSLCPPIHNLFHSLSLPLSLSHSLFLSIFLSLSHTHTLARTHSHSLVPFSNINHWWLRYLASPNFFYLPPAPI